MIGRLERLAARQGLVISRAQALALGYTDDQLKVRLRSGAWVRVRRGVYADAQLVRSLDRGGRHAVSIHAARLALEREPVFSHISAAVVHRWDSWNVPLDMVTITRSPPHRPRRKAGVHCHVATLADDEVVEVNGVRVTSPERTMADVARAYGFEQAVVLCDAALRSGADRSVAAALFRRQFQWPGSRQAMAAIEFATDGSESVGESRLRVLCHLEGLPEPIVQAPIQCVDGRLVARCDLLFSASRTVGEFDGKLKYGIELNSGVDPRDALFREKQREDAIREAGFEVVRVVWRDLNEPARTAERFRAAFARAEARIRAA